MQCYLKVYVVTNYKGAAIVIEVGRKDTLPDHVINLRFTFNVFNWQAAAYGHANAC